MKVYGIIAEYNPLHNGHMIHLNKIKEKNPDLIIGVISSSFTMRGDLSIYDKFTKCKEALEAGIDIVLELPFAYTMQRADIYANNTVSILNLMKVNNIVIGSETDNSSLYEAYYNNKAPDNQADKSYRENAGIDLKSNDILGYSYYKAIKDNNYNIELSTIKRQGSDYNDTTISSDIISASAIRANIDKIKEFTPEFTHKDIEKTLDENKLFDLIKYKILSSDVAYLKSIFFVDEGIENKLKDIKNFNTLDEFITYLSGKKYTKTRMKRMLIYILMDIKKDELNKIASSPIDFVRVLGYSKKGKEYLKTLKKDLTIYTNIKNNINDIFDIELKVSSILDSVYNLDLFKTEMKGPISINEQN